VRVTDAELRILVLGEEDASGLWEILWDLPASLDDPRGAESREALRGLVISDLVTGVRRLGLFGPWLALEKQEFLSAIDDEANWIAPVDWPSTHFETTKRGAARVREAMQQGWQSDSAP
jgi:hypothetical protein